jgi:hypothetical protein
MLLTRVNALAALLLRAARAAGCKSLGTTYQGEGDPPLGHAEILVQDHTGEPLRIRIERLPGNLDGF